MAHLTSSFAERATLIESGGRSLLDARQFAAHATDVVCGALESPSTMGRGPANLSEPVSR
ncbi:MAG: hypothetical protein WD598_00565 [Acidimicrobiia bacterium]